MTVAGHSREQVAQLYAYNRWANARTLEAAAVLAPEELSRAVGGSFASVLGTLTHLVGAEWVWLERWHGRSPRALPQGFSGIEELRARLGEVEAAQHAVVESLTPAKLAEKIAYQNFKGETYSYALGDMLVHLVNHSTYHRGQVSTLLRQLEKKPLSTDYLLYLDGRG